jgi:hypothetical protein
MASGLAGFRSAVTFNVVALYARLAYSPFPLPEVAMKKSSRALLAVLMAAACAESPPRETALVMTGTLAYFCPDLPTLRRFIEENNQRFGGEGCSIINPNSFAIATKLGEQGSYTRVRLVTKYDEKADGWVETVKFAPK